MKQKSKKKRIITQSASHRNYLIKSGDRFLNPSKDNRYRIEYLSAIMYNVNPRGMPSWVTKRNPNPYQNFSRQLYRLANQIVRREGITLKDAIVKATPIIQKRKDTFKKSVQENKNWKAA